MDNQPADDSVFAPDALFPVDSLLTEQDLALLQPDMTPGGGGGPQTGPVPGPQTGPAPGPQTGPVPSGGSGSPSIFDIPTHGDINPLDALSTIPGIGAITSLLGVVVAVVSDVEKIAKTGANLHPFALAGKFLQFIEHVPRIAEIGVQDFWGIVTDVTAGPIMTSLLEGGLGVSVSQFNDSEKSAIDTIDRMVGFAAAIQFGVAALDFAGEAVAANRWSKSLKDTVAKIPEEMGLSWALGLVINRMFEASLGVILDEAIGKQKRPNRIAWQQLRPLLKQHVLPENKFDELMMAQGFPDEQIDLLKKLQDNPIPVGDIAQLWYRDVIDDTAAKKLIAKLGFDDEQTGWLFDLYVRKSENEATTTYRTTARGLYINQLITEAMYRGILEHANYPKKLVDSDIAAVKLEQSVGKILQSVSVIKSRYQHGQIDSGEATKELGELNYAPSFVSELIQTWDSGPTRKTHGLSQSKILSYYVSGIISRSAAEPQLLATGLDQASTTFLLDHPTANGGTKLHALTPGLVTQAYTDGILPLDDLAAAFKKANVAPDNIGTYVDIAKYRLAHKKGAAGANIPLNAGELKQGYKVGLLDFQTLVSDLEILGYSPENALFLAEIENKGPYQQPTPPVFKTLADAISYLDFLGYTVVPPPDPKIEAAEAMLAAAGYSWTPPPAPVFIPGQP